jgi:DEAD/DEAH box helicase
MGSNKMKRNNHQTNTAAIIGRRRRKGSSSSTGDDDDVKVIGKHPSPWRAVPLDLGEDGIDGVDGGDEDGGGASNDNSADAPSSSSILKNNKNKSKSSKLNLTQNHYDDPTLSKRALQDLPVYPGEDCGIFYGLEVLDASMYRVVETTKTTTVGGGDGTTIGNSSKRLVINAIPTEDVKQQQRGGRSGNNNSNNKNDDDDDAEPFTGERRPAHVERKDKSKKRPRSTTEEDEKDSEDVDDRHPSHQPHHPSSNVDAKKNNIGKIDVGDTTTSPESTGTIDEETIHKKKKKKKRKKNKRRKTSGDGGEEEGNNDNAPSSSVDSKDGRNTKPLDRHHSQRGEADVAANPSSSLDDVVPVENDDEDGDTGGPVVMMTPEQLSDIQTSWGRATGGASLHPTLLESLHKLGFIQPTPIQAATLSASIMGRRNMVGAAPTGSGKTLAFLLPILNTLLEESSSSESSEQTESMEPAGDEEDRGVRSVGDDDTPDRQQKEHQHQQQVRRRRSAPPSGSTGAVAAVRALIMTPTRELASQIHAECDKLLPNRCATLVGGIALVKQARILQTRRPPIIVATPGRLWAMVRETIPTGTTTDPRPLSSLSVTGGDVLWSISLPSANLYDR